jgi:RimJ/RimL family protein N-acetyltransferase
MQKEGNTDGSRRRREERSHPETERLVLRPLSGEDAHALHCVSNEAAMRRYLWDGEPFEEGTILELISRSIRMFSEEGIGLFGVRRHGSENHIGFCGFVRLEGMEEPELAYELTRGAWAKISPPRHP